VGRVDAGAFARDDQLGEFCEKPVQMIFEVVIFLVCPFKPARMPHFLQHSCRLKCIGRAEGDQRSFEFVGSILDSHGILCRNRVADLRE
jgi:hypothetical protein